ncbi:hypothetical protein K8R30_00735 [archaeon]|nr:hypothetical protein [archaeon]
MRLCFLLLGLVLLGNVSAYTFVDIYLDGGGSALFLGGTDENVSFPGGVVVEDGDVIGKTQVLTSKAGEVWSFSYFLDGAEITLVLPKGATIKSIEEGEIFVKGNKIRVYGFGEIELTYIIGEQSSNLVLWVSVGVFVFVLFGFLFYGWGKLGKRVGGKEKLIRNVLGKRENLILDKLKQTGRVKSSQLKKICDIPKASFSRHIQELERKGLLKRTGEGRNKFLELV